MRPVWLFIAAADGQLSDNNAEDEHGFDLRWDPQLLDSSSWLIREKNKPYSNRGEYTRASGMRPVWPFIPAADGQLSDNNAEDEHGLDQQFPPNIAYVPQVQPMCVSHGQGI